MASEIYKRQRATALTYDVKMLIARDIGKANGPKSDRAHQPEPREVCTLEQPLVAPYGVVVKYSRLRLGILERAASLEAGT